jgi:hypothetical protein
MGLYITVDYEVTQAKQILQSKFLFHASRYRVVDHEETGRACRGLTKFMDVAFVDSSYNEYRLHVSRSVSAESITCALVLPMDRTLRQVVMYSIFTI